MGEKIRCPICGKWHIPLHKKNFCSLRCAYAAVRAHSALLRSESMSQTKYIKLKVDPRRLPKPLLAPTREVRAETPDDKAIRELYEAVQRQRAIGDRLREMAKKNGRKPFTPKEDAAIMQMANDGRSSRDIAEALGRPYPSVVARRKRIFFDLGVT